MNDDLSHYAEQLISKAKAEGIQLTEDPQKVKHMVSRDIRDMLPPQLYELIGIIAGVVEQVTHEEK